MKKLALTATLALGVLAAAPSAMAQTTTTAQGCLPGSWLCADISITTGRPVVQQPPVVVAPPPPQVVYVPARPRIIYQTPPPVVVYQPQPQYTYVQQPVYYPQPQVQRPGWFGLTLGLGGVGMTSAGGGAAGMGGLTAAVRLRTRGVFGVELGAGIFGGRDFNGDTRFEIPAYANALFYLNPQNAVQAYLLGGVGFSIAGVEYSAANRAAHGGRNTAGYMYLGGTAGIGVEWQINPRFSVFADARAFLRTRIDREREINPEFARTTATGTTQTTNTSIGVMGQLGAAVYF